MVQLQNRRQLPRAKVYVRKEWNENKVCEAGIVSRRLLIPRHDDELDPIEGNLDFLRSLHLVEDLS
jgi:hypothetical protein